MPRRYPLYRPPPLDKRVWIRDPDARPDDVDRFETDPEAAPGWGASGVWAAKRDRHARFQSEEDVAVFEGDTVFTIRFRDGVAANAEVVYRDKIYEAQGEPLERGGAGSGRSARYLEIVTKLRQ